MDIGRHAFLTGAMAAAATTMGAGRASALGRPAWFTGLSGLVPTSVKLIREEHRVVIIGSGFGGGVSALRLAQAGVNDIVVLERGKRWPTGPNAQTFPDAEHLDERLLWYGSAPTVLPGLLPDLDRPRIPALYAGLLEAHVGANMTVLNAAGVGGGSIVYQGMTLQPARAVFEETFPSGLDYTELDRTYYPRVARMLQVETAPDELIDSPSYLAPRIFRRNALKAGYTVDKIPMPIDWRYALAELRGEMRPSYTNGDCFMGVNNGGKHSVDVTYIGAAEATGRVKVEPLHNVTRIGRTPQARWRIEVEYTDVHGTVLEHKEITTDTLILAAGYANTSKMLMRAKYEGTIPGLSDDIGHGWGSNGDRIVAWTSLTDDFGAVQGGPVVFGSKEWHDPSRANTIVQASIPPLGVDPRSTIIVGFGVSKARAQWTYDPLLDTVMVDWPREHDAVLHRRIWERMTKIAGPGGILTDTHTPAPMTWHPLGGACMDKVCDLEGRVKHQPGLYVLDGALMPGTTAACNPSMTIAAIAERAMDDIIRTEVGTTI